MILRKSFKIVGEIIAPGERKTIELPLASLFTHTPMNIPVYIIHGKKPGPTLFITAAIHGNEINGVEIIKRLIKSLKTKSIHGTLIAVPVVNVFGFIALSRYLPDRRDLNRSFPGTRRGSLAARIANLLMNEIIKKSTHGLDLHTGGLHRTNLPQIRINLELTENLTLAKAFNAPVIINANLRDGSIRQACNDLKIPLLVYEAGEALRFDEIAIRVGLKGIFNVMRKIDMLRPTKQTHPTARPVKEPKIARSTAWVRAPQSGILHSIRQLGNGVKRGELLGLIEDPFGQGQKEIFSPAKGIIIGKTTLPLVNTGDALYHIAAYRKLKRIVSQLDGLQNYDVDMLS